MPDSLLMVLGTCSHLALLSLSRGIRAGQDMLDKPAARPRANPLADTLPDLCQTSTTAPPQESQGPAVIWLFSLSSCNQGHTRQPHNRITDTTASTL